MKKNNVSVSRLKNWVADVFSKEVEAVLPFPILDFNIRYTRQLKKEGCLIRIVYNSLNYSSTIFLCNPQFLNAWKNGRKELLKKEITKELASLYLGRVRLLLSKKHRSKRQVKDVFDELQGNIALLMRVVLN